MAIALGSNLGDRHGTIREAVIALGRVLDDVAVSTLHETAPIGAPHPQPQYLNAAVTGTTRLSPQALLSALHAIERRFGRERPFPNAPRTLDLDLIFYGAMILDEPGLVVPHPRFRQRRFVLDPLVEVAGHMVDPVTGLNVRELRDALS